MSGYVKICFIIAGIVATLTFAVSIPVNLLGTSLIRALVAFLFFMVTSLGLGWLFRRFSSQDGVIETTGEHIDLKTPDDPNIMEDIYALPDNQSEQTAPFEPLSAPKLKAEQLADVIRKQNQN